MLAAEALGLIAVVIFLVVAELNASSPNVRGVVAVTLYASIMVAVLAGLSWALLRPAPVGAGSSRGAPAPAAADRVLHGHGRPGPLGVPVMAVGLGGVATLLAPATRAGLGNE